MTANSNPVHACSKIRCGPRVTAKIRPVWCLVVLLLIILVQSSKSVAQTAQDPMFAAAMQHIKIEEWQQAEGLLKFMLSQDKELHRARLELGRVYANLNKHQQARAEFNTLLDHPAVPEKVKQNIRRLLQQLPNSPTQMLQISSDSEPEKKPAAVSSTPKVQHQFTGNVQFSIGYDDNVRYSAADYFLEDDPFLNGVFLEDEDGTLLFVAPDGFVYDEEGNLLFENDGFLDLGNPDRENSFVEARMELNHQYQFASTQGLSWYNQLSLQATENQQLSDFNRLQLRIESGLAWRLSQQWKLDLAAHHRLLERDGQVQVKAFALTPELTYFNELGSWTLGIQWLRREYADSLFITGELETIYEGFDNNINSFSGKWSNLFWDSKLLVLAKIEYSDSNASDDFDYKGRRFTLASIYKISEAWDLLLSADDFHQDYSESFEGPLDDDILTFRSRLTWQMTDDLLLFLAGERAIRTSDIYGGLKSDKSLLQLGVELGF